MPGWCVAPCDVCNRQTITEHPDGMVVCSVCLDRWDAEDVALPVEEEDDDFDDDEDGNYGDC
ncbi:MAG: hypothetical protein ACREI9_14410 [Nitrospiraceae bacterium]